MYEKITARIKPFDVTKKGRQDELRIKERLT
jgi:hypothetical protein